MFDLPFSLLKQYFLCLEVFPSSVRGLLFHVDEDRKMKTLRYWDNFPADFFSQKIRPFQFFPPVIVAVHPSLVYTAVVPVQFERLSASAPLGSVELENHISQLLTKHFNAERKEASRFLGVGEIETVLVQSRLFHFKVGDREVLDPVGIQAKKVFATLEATFTTRTIFEEWKEFFNGKGDFYFADANRARASSLGKVWEKPYGLLTVSSRATHYYFIADSVRRTPVRQGSFPWGRTHLAEPLMKRWGITEKVAHEAIECYAHRTLSESVHNRIEELLGPSQLLFGKNLDRLKLNGTLSLHGMNSALFSKGESSRLHEPPLKPLLAKLGFSLVEKIHVPNDILFDFVAYYLEFYYDKSNSVINRWLNRRVHWLSPVRSSAPEIF